MLTFPVETIRGAIDERVPSETIRAPEVLVETMDDDDEVNTTVEIDMFAMSNDRGVP
jgi:hypothetical protein